jgi:hypothetical protein
MTMTALGENSIFDLYSSKYLVNPPCPEGILILLSRAIIELIIALIYKIC